ncbi:hypothetical protein [Pseudodesulfovibrio tunisiensis]|uniref:hypothetical protein n=1 Tax=Pseudodesulfovibrio tunisiensis TaxID=463192 RepID=UPI001FB1B876|nr:hypothetical protein [Pseudodesulfovibrio tunisiensis]
MFEIIAPVLFLNESLEPTPPQVRHHVLIQSERIHTAKKIVIGGLPVQKDLAPQRLIVSGIQLLFVQAAPPCVINASEPRQTTKITHIPESFRLRANPSENFTAHRLFIVTEDV